MRKAIIGGITGGCKLLDKWLTYYSKTFDRKDIYLINVNGSVVDNCFNNARNKFQFNEIIPYEILGSSSGPHFINRMLKQLLATYDVVALALCDEFLIPNSNYKDLNEYIEHLERPYVYCIGRAIVHDFETELPLDWERPLLEQRRYWVKEMDSYKPSITKVPFEWIEGYHKIKGDEDRNLEKFALGDLYFLHLRRIDYDHFKKVDRSFSKEQPTEWFLHDRKEWEEIPEQFKHII